MSETRLQSRLTTVLKKIFLKRKPTWQWIVNLLSQQYVINDDSVTL